MSVENGFCRSEIGNQMGVGTVKYTNGLSEGTPILTAVANLTSLTFTHGGGCPGATGTFHNGTYTGEWTVKGTVPPSIPAGVEVESTPAAPFSTFVAEEAPATITGADVNTNYVLRGESLVGNGFHCKKFNLAGSASSTTPSSLTLVPSYNECKWIVTQEATPANFFSAGSCSYVLHPNGGFDIAGVNCAANPMTITKGPSEPCVVTIGPNSLPGPLSFVNEGSGRLRTVSVPTTTIKGVTFTATGSGCNNTGTFSTGKIYVKSKLSATNSGGEVQGLSIE
jgi:hypothetical protein